MLVLIVYGFLIICLTNTLHGKPWTPTQRAHGKGGLRNTVTVVNCCGVPIGRAALVAFFLKKKKILPPFLIISFNCWLFVMELLRDL